MIPISGIPHIHSLYRFCSDIPDFLKTERTPGKFFRDIADGNISEEFAESLNKPLFGYLVFDYRENYAFFRTLNERLKTLNQTTGEYLILWTMLSHPQDETAHMPNSPDYRLWNWEAEYYTSKFTITCLNELGITASDKPILILAKSLTSNNVIIAEFNQDRINVDRIEQLFSEISRQAENLPIHERINTLSQIFECYGLHYSERKIKNGLSFAHAIANVYEAFFNDENFRSELQRYY